MSRKSTARRSSRLNGRLREIIRRSNYSIIESIEENVKRDEGGTKDVKAVVWQACCVSTICP